MMRYITLDLGTTKSSISLVDGGKVKDSLKAKSTGDAADYKSTISAGISELLERNGLTESDITSILATGTMASAEMGIYPLEHAVAPIGMEGIKRTAVTVSIPEISPVPFFITRGVKTLDSNGKTTDMMRGEESEIYGFGAGDIEECVYMLMGSHTKMVRTDKDGRIADISTMLTGELAAALVTSTILRHSVEFDGCEIDPEYLSLGYKHAVESSMSEALFKVRVLRNNHGVSASKAYSFFIGAILAGEIGYVLASGAKRVTVSGNKYLKDAVAMLLAAHTDAEVICIDDEESESAVSLGLVRIFETEISKTL